MISALDARSQSCDNYSKTRSSNSLLDLLTERIDDAVDRGVFETSVLVQSFPKNSIDTVRKILKFKGYRASVRDKVLYISW